MKELLATFTVTVPVLVTDDLKHCDPDCDNLYAHDRDPPTICRLLTPGNEREWYQNPRWDTKAKAYRRTRRCLKSAGR